GATTTDIKSFIQTAYNTWEIPPEYVLLFGDTSGDYTLAAWETYQIDHPYSQLDGDDILADVAIGRLPAASPAMADMMVNKQLCFEKTPYVAYPNWFRQGLLVSGSYYSGISPVQVGRWIKTRFVEHGYTRVDTLWYTTPSLDPAYIVNSIDGGMSFFNYRGWVSMGGFGNGNIDQLTNGAMLPFATIPTCGTGGFSGDSNMKHFVSVGTVSTPKGAIGAVGTATSSTHTRFNNTLAIGIYAGLFDEDITQEGTALNRGKVELYNAYGQNDLSNVISFSKWNALAGDPGCDLFTGPIRFMNCTIPDIILYGVNVLDLTVTEPSVGPVPGATVCLYRPNEMQYVGETDILGHITLPINVTTTGGMKVTITRQGFYPIIDSLSVAQTDVVVGYLSNTIDDDNSGGSHGDGDGIVNPGETVELSLVYKNFGFSTTATNVSATATENDDYAALIDNAETFPNMAPGQTANSYDDFDLSVAPDCPDGHVIHLMLSNQADQGAWGGGMDLSVVSYQMQFQSYYATGIDTLLSPGEVAGVILIVKNIGNKTAAGLSATCNSLSPYVTVVDNAAYFGTINVGSVGNCDTNPFGLSVSSNIPLGTRAKFRIVYTSASSAAQIDTVSIQIGTKTQVDPQGPDAYGYYCFDNTDFNYPEHPVYNWVEISTIGTQLPIEDPAENQDQSINVNLPFTFRYYGEAVNVITVCSNGWIAANSNPSFNDFRNYPIPGAPGPSGMIAPFWDDLITTSGGHVYSYYDVANRRFIVEWYHMPNFGNTSVLETFEVILYDPAYTPTPTGDGEIVFQYNTITEVNGAGDDNPFSTVGIESPDQQDGIQVVYWNTYYDVAAAHVQNQRAYKFTTSDGYIIPSLPLDVTTSPTNPGVIIPANGGSFQYNVNVHNLTTQTQIFSLWNKVRNQANVYTNVFGPITRSLPGGANPSRVLTQTIAGSISSGTLYFISYIGSYPYGIVDSSYFTITKLATQGGGSWINESFVTGDLFTEYQVGVEAILPVQFTLDQNYPNPFNPMTTLNFSLPEKALVKLEIYNIAGQRIATLIDSWREPGNHQVTWDASGEAAGIYLVRLTAGTFEATGKIVLLK
ncbi:MAG: C25 family cysteine peptidase, partial [bacterium]|nr:C25 family cysteine peptidase [bacterium]